MADPTPDDILWQQALDWVLRDHEQPLGPDEAARLRAWLDADEAHRRAYRDARHVWLLTGLVPPSATPAEQGDAPPDPGTDDR